MHVFWVISIWFSNAWMYPTVNLTLQMNIALFVFLSFSASPHLSLPHLEPFAAFPPDMTGEFELSASGVNVCTSCSLPCSAVIVYSDDLGFVLLASMRYLCSRLRSLGLGRLFKETNPFWTYLRSRLGKMLKHGRQAAEPMRLICHNETEFGIQGIIPQK